MSVSRVALRWLWRAAALVLLIVLAVQVWFFGHIALWKWTNPGETAFMAQELERLRKANPKAQLRVQWVPYERISAHLKRAVVTAEDARFTEHEGVEWEAIQKAFEENLRRGRRAKGGSTITQQLAKNLFLSSEKSYLRKAQELVITYMIEFAWDKRRILEVYLNVVEWGEGVFGAEAAARHYYGKPAADVTRYQAAALAAVIPSPRRRTPQRMGGYASAILRRMHQHGW